MKRNKPTPRYSKDTKVLVKLFKNHIWQIKDEPVWNGLTWMYAFHGTDVRCGEMYLNPCDQAAMLGTLADHHDYEKDKGRDQDIEQINPFLSVTHKPAYETILIKKNRRKNADQ